MTSFGILKVEKAIFTLFPAFSCFPDFHNLSDLGRSKSVLGSFFAFLRNGPKNMYHAAQAQDFHIDLSLTS